MCGTPEPVGARKVKWSQDVRGAAHVQVMTDDLTDDLAAHALLEVTVHASMAAELHRQFTDAATLAREQWARLFDAVVVARSSGVSWDEIIVGSRAAPALAMWRTLGASDEVRYGEQDAPSMAQMLRAARTREEIVEIMLAQRPAPVSALPGLSVTQAALRLSVPRSSVLAWLESGVLQAHDLGTRGPRVMGIA